MFRIPKIIIVSFCLVSCASNKNLLSTENEKVSPGAVSDTSLIPSCLAARIRVMRDDVNQGSPVSITRYQYQGQTVFYMRSPCCDKFNIVFDSTCTILGYPDGGFTGRGDGKMPGFYDEATEAKQVWERPQHNNF